MSVSLLSVSNSSSIYPIAMVVPLCPSPPTLQASTPLSWVVQLVSWLYQEHLVQSLPIWWEKMVVIKRPTYLDQTRTLQDPST